MSTQEAQIKITAVDRASYVVLGIAEKLEKLHKASEKQSSLRVAFGELGKQLEPLGKKWTGIGDAWGKATRRLTYTGLAVGGPAAGLTKFAHDAAEAADNVGDLAERYQLSTRSLQVFGSMLKDNGFTLEDTAAGMGKLKKSINEALHGDNKSAVAAFAGVGISVERLKKMKPEEVMLAMADAFKGSEKDMAKQAVLLQLMGKSGTQFMAAMNAGSGAYRQRLKEMIEDQSLFDNEQIATAGRFADKWGRMSRTMDALRTRIGMQLAQRLEPLLDKFQKWLTGGGAAKIAKEFDKLFTTENIQAFADTLLSIGKAVAGLAKAFAGVVNTIGPTATIWAGLAVALAPLGGALASTASGLWTTGRAVAAVAGMVPGLSANLLKLGGILKWVGGVGAAAFVGWEIGSALNDKLNAMIKKSTGGKEESLGGLLYGRTHNEDINSKEFGQFSWRKLLTGEDREIKNTIELKINADGGVRVVDARAGSANTTINVNTGLAMVGS